MYLSIIYLCVGLSSVRPSVRLTDCLTVRPSVRPSVYWHRRRGGFSQPAAETASPPPEAVGPVIAEIVPGPRPIVVGRALTQLVAADQDRESMRSSTSTRSSTSHQSAGEHAVGVAERKLVPPICLLTLASTLRVT